MEAVQLKIRSLEITKLGFLLKLFGGQTDHQFPISSSQSWQTDGSFPSSQSFKHLNDT